MTNMLAKGSRNRDSDLTRWRGPVEIPKYKDALHMFLRVTPGSLSSLSIVLFTSDHISLWPSYRLSKFYADRYVCGIRTASEEIHVGATDQSSIDTFAFNLQTQTILRDNLEGKFMFY